MLEVEYSLILVNDAYMNLDEEMATMFKSERFDEVPYYIQRGKISKIMPGNN